MSSPIIEHIKDALAHGFIHSDILYQIDPRDGDDELTFFCDMHICFNKQYDPEGITTNNIDYLKSDITDICLYLNIIDHNDMDVSNKEQPILVPYMRTFSSVISLIPNTNYNRSSELGNAMISSYNNCFIRTEKTRDFRDDKLDRLLDLYKSGVNPILTESEVEDIFALADLYKLNES